MTLGRAERQSGADFVALVDFFESGEVGEFGRGLAVPLGGHGEEVVEIERNQPREEHYGMRQHQVRGHWRVLKNEFGEVRKRIWIDSFVRGNPKLGIVYKDYVLEGDKQKIKEEQLRIGKKVQYLAIKCLQGF